MVASGSQLNYSPLSLGCGDYKVFYRNRCALNSLLCEADVVDGSFNRVLNEISEAEIQVRLHGGSEDCCDCYNDLAPWQHELVIYRDQKEVWCGPIQRIELDFAAGIGTVQARDLLAWADKRLIELAETDYDVTDVDLKDVFEWVLWHGYCKDPWCMTWSFQPVGIPITKFYPAYSSPEKWGGTYPNCGEELRDLAKSGIDYTVIDRHLWGGDIEVQSPVANTALLLDHHWQSTPKIIVAGADMVNRMVYVGGNSGYSGYDEDTMWIEPPSPYGPITATGLDGTQQQYGLLEGLRKAQGMDEVDTSVVPNPLTQAAAGEYALTQAPFVYIEGGTLSPKAPLEFDALIPGSRFDVRISNTCRIADNHYRLYGVDIAFGPGVETVNLKLAPIGIDAVRSA